MPVSTLRSSGDLLADRRYAYAQGSFDEKDFAAAADLAAQTIERVPGFAPAHALLGRAQAALGRREEAANALGRALELEPDDALGVRIELARLGVLAPHEAIAEGYVRALFDQYAEGFDRHLIESLSYRGPEIVAEALRLAARGRSRPARFARILDLGCGTGLMARALEGSFDAAEGVDLSPGMLQQAARTPLYEHLHEGELVAFLQGRPEASADLVVAADVFVYMADLAAALRESRRVLAHGGFLAFTVQAHDGDGFALGDDARYAHSEGYLRALAAGTGLTTVLLERVSTRRDRGEDVPGLVAVMER